MIDGMDAIHCAKSNDIGLESDYRSVGDYSVLVYDYDAVVDGVGGVVAVLAFYVVYANAAAHSYACVHVDDGLSYEGSFSYSNVWYANFTVVGLLLVRFVVGGTHAVDSVEGRPAFYERTDSNYGVDYGCVGYDGALGCERA